MRVLPTAPLQFLPGLDDIVAHILDNHERWCAKALTRLEETKADETALGKMRGKPAALRARFDGKLGEKRVKTAVERLTGPSARTTPVAEIDDDVEAGGAASAE